MMRRVDFEAIQDLLNADGDHQVHVENAYLIAVLVSGTSIRSGLGLCSCSSRTSRRDCNWIHTRTKQQIRERFRSELFMRCSPYQQLKYPRYAEAAGTIQILRESHRVVMNQNRKALLVDVSPFIHRPLKGCTRLI